MNRILWYILKIHIVFRFKGEKKMGREKFASRLGFILISAGCAIGLGNVWRFPYIVGQYGGAAFVLLYLACLVLLGLPVIVMEYAVGRASQKSIALSFEQIEPKGSKWHIYKWFGMAGNYLLMMYYTTITGWLLYYFVKMIRGDFNGLDAEGVGAQFTGMLGQPEIMVGYMIAAVTIGFAICMQGLQNGVERITKYMMLALLCLMVVLAINSVVIPGGKAGLEFYLKPDFGKIREAGIGSVLFAAFGQAFFTLSIGIGAMAIFGSYIGKERRLTGEAVNVLLLDTFVAFMSGLIIFPACAAYGIEANAGPGLIFVTLPNVFNHMPLGRFWGALFFVFMSFAALSTEVAVFQNIVSFATDLTGCSVKKACAINYPIIVLLSLPCTLGYNVLSFIQPLGAGSTVLDFEDFIVSNNLLPIGSLVYLLFCTANFGWGYQNFEKEANEGMGISFPRSSRLYVTYLCPLILMCIFVQGYIASFA